MPLYEYECQKCGRRTEKIEPLSGPHLKKCPHCGGKVERAVTAPAIQFKGTGWYVTDYAGKSSTKDGVSTEKSDGDKKEAPKESAGKEAKDSGEKKGAKKK